MCVALPATQPATLLALRAVKLTVWKVVITHAPLDAELLVLGTIDQAQVILRRHTLFNLQNSLNNFREFFLFIYLANKDGYLT